MISLSAFSDELQKIAARRIIREGEKKLQLAPGIPLIGRLPKDPTEARARLNKLVESEKARAVLGYKNIAVRESAMPDLKSMGFKPTRIATPLPGEKALSISWRSGKLHAHKLGPMFLMHKDETAPMKGRLGYLRPSAIKHGIREGIPSVIKRMKETEHLVREVM